MPKFTFKRSVEYRASAWEYNSASGETPEEAFANLKDYNWEGDDNPQVDYNNPEVDEPIELDQIDGIPFYRFSEEQKALRQAFYQGQLEDEAYERDTETVTKEDLAQISALVDQNPKGEITSSALEALEG